MKRIQAIIVTSAALCVVAILAACEFNEPRSNSEANANHLGPNVQPVKIDTPADEEPIIFDRCLVGEWKATKVIMVDDPSAVGGTGFSVNVSGSGKVTIDYSDMLPLTNHGTNGSGYKWL